MRTVGIVAEYDPFHRGHAMQLRAAKEASGAEAAVVVMSTVFTQRGEAAICAPRLRTEMALRAGADAVAALPVLWSTRSAEGFAEAGVHLLHAMGAEAISFGAETADAGLMWEGARLLENPDSRFVSLLKEQLAQGHPYPKALAAAAASLDAQLGALLASPNNTLGLCYLRAALRLAPEMKAFPIPRTTGYHSGATGRFASATAVRRAMLNGCWSAACNALEDPSLLMQAASDNHLHRPEALDMVLLSRLRTMSPEEYAALPDLSEGLEDRLATAARTALNRQELLQALKSRRYPYARLSRLTTHAMLGMTQKLMAENPLPPAVLLLGYRKSARPLLGQIAAGPLPLLTQAREMNIADAWLAVENHAWDLWALGAGLPCGMLFSERLVTV